MKPYAAIGTFGGRGCAEPFLDEGFCKVPLQDRQSVSGDEAPEDAALVRGACEGRLACYDVLVRRYEGRLTRFLRQRTGDRLDAEDIAQEAFIAAWRNLRRFDPERPFAPWLFTIAARLAVDRHRARGERCLPLSAADGVAMATESPAVDSEQAERLWRLARASMPLAAYLALWLRYVESMTVKEVAGVTGRSTVHVRVLLHRGRSALGKALAQCDEPWAGEMRLQGGTCRKE